MGYVKGICIEFVRTNYFFFQEFTEFDIHVFHF